MIVANHQGNTFPRKIKWSLNLRLHYKPFQIDKQRITKPALEDEYLSDAYIPDEITTETDNNGKSERAPLDLNVPYKPRHANI